MQWFIGWKKCRRLKTFFIAQACNSAPESQKILKWLWFKFEPSWYISADILICFGTIHLGCLQILRDFLPLSLLLAGFYYFRLSVSKFLSPKIADVVNGLDNIIIGRKYVTVISWNVPTGYKPSK